MRLRDKREFSGGIAEGAVKKASKEKEGFSQEKYLAESFFSGIIKLR